MAGEECNGALGGYADCSSGFGLGGLMKGGNCTREGGRLRVKPGVGRICLPLI